MADSIADLAEEILGRISGGVQLKIGKVTAVDTTAERRVQLDVTGDAWLTTDTNVSLAVGQRVYALASGSAWIVAGRLDSGSPATPVGTILMYAGTSAPEGFLLCQGQTLTTSVYPALATAMGATGSVFTLPDLRGVFPLGAGGSYSAGQTGGVAQVTLTVDQIPAHKHSTVPHSHTVPNGGNTVNAASGTGATPVGGSSSTTGNAQPDTYNTGGGQPFNNMPPYRVINYIIRVR